MFVFLSNVRFITCVGYVGAGLQAIYPDFVLSNFLATSGQLYGRRNFVDECFDTWFPSFDPANFTDVDDVLATTWKTDMCVLEYLQTLDDYGMEPALVVCACGCCNSRRWCFFIVFSLSFQVFRVV